MSLVERALKKMQEGRAVTPHGVAPMTEVVVQPHSDPAPHRQTAAEVPARPLSTRVVRMDRDALRAAEILPPVDQERQLAREYRQIKRPLIANALGHGAAAIPNGQLIMLASALPGDGKTFTSINLALSMALEKDISVLLVDADVAKGDLSEIFGVRSEPGLMDVLQDESLDVESVILRTDVPGLSILPAGKVFETATELIASARMQKVVAGIGARHPQRIVLLDSPPLLLTTEARALAGVVGQVVLVVRAGTTPQQAVFDALDILGEGKSIGLVLNQCETRPRGGYYDYDYYGSRQYGEPQDKTP